MKPPLLLVGAGGHCRSCIEAVESAGDFQIAGIVGRRDEVGSKLLGYTVRGTDDDLPKMIREFGNALVAVGQIRTPLTRISLYQQLVECGATMPVVCASTAVVSRHASVDDGCVIMHGAVVNAGASIGANTIINSTALIEHDCVVGTHCHVSTRAVLNGDVKVGDGTFIGSGAIVFQGVRIGNRCIVSAGSIVDRDVPDHKVFRSRATR